MHLFGRLRSALMAAAVLAALGAAERPLVAQSAGTIRGKVVEAGSLRPLSGVQVTVAGTNRGALTNPNGGFLLVNVPVGTHTVRAQLIGYGSATQTVTVTVGETATADFQLRAAAVELDALVVTGTPGATQKRALGNSVTQVQADDITKTTTVTSVTEVLQARTPGVQIMPNSGVAGTAANITIRGVGSFINNDPVVYIDGVKVNTGGLGTFTPSGAGTTGYSGQRTDAFSLINPNDIESIEIIKGPAAATLYGAEAAGGVIQIITKKGKAGQQRPQWTLRGEYGHNRWGGKPPTNYTTCSPDRIALRDREGEPVYPGCQGVDEYAVLTDSPLLSDPMAHRDGNVEALSLAVRGGGEGYSYYLNLDQHQEQGVFYNNHSNKRSVRANFSFSPTEKLNVSVNSSYLNNHVRLPLGDESWGGILYSGYRGQPGRKYSNGVGWFSSNPEQANSYNNQTASDRVTLGATAQYQPISWFTNRMTVGMDYTSSRAQIIDAPGSFYTPRGLHAMRVPRTWLYTLDYAGSLRQSFLNDALGSTTSFGLQVAAQNGETIYARGLGLGAPGITLIGTAQEAIGSNSYYESNSVGTFLQQEFSWQDRLFVTAAARADDHSSFGEEFDFIIYPKFSASYVVSEEPALQSFFEGLSASNIRLRAAWGQAGRAPSAYSARRTYGVGRVALSETGVGSALRTGGYGNPDLRPELGTEVELGFDAAFLDNRLGAEFTYYNKKTTDLLMPTPVAPSTGWVGSQYINVGEMANRGLELAVWGTPIATPAVVWEPRVTLSTNQNELVDFGTDIEKQIPWQPYGQWNVRQENREGYPMAGWWAWYPKFDENGAPVLNSRGALTWSDSAVYVGPAMPKWEAAFSNTVTLFNNLRLYTLLDAKGGHYLYNAREYYRCRFSDNCERLNDPEFRRAALIDKDPAARAEYELWRTAQPMYLAKADFIKLRDVSLTYTLPGTWIERFGGSTASVTVAGRNLALWTDYPGLDPEVNTYGNRSFVRVDAYAQPMLERWSLSFNVGF